MKAYIVEVKVAVRVVTNNRDFVYHKAIRDAKRVDLTINNVSKITEDKQNPFGVFDSDYDDLESLRHRIIQLEEDIENLKKEHV